MQTEFGIAQPMHDAEIETPMVAAIRFDAIVRMNDVGYRKKEPQWFAIQEKITIEAIMHESDAALGRNLKDMFAKLQIEIEKYKNQK